MAMVAMVGSPTRSGIVHNNVTNPQVNPNTEHFSLVTVFHKFRPSLSISSIMNNEALLFNAIELITNQLK